MSTISFDCASQWLAESCKIQTVSIQKSRVQVIQPRQIRIPFLCKSAYPSQTDPPPNIYADGALAFPLHCQAAYHCLDEYIVVGIIGDASTYLHCHWQLRPGSGVGAKEGEFLNPSSSSQFRPRPLGNPTKCCVKYVNSYRETEEKATKSTIANIYFPSRVLGDRQIGRGSA
jgi:hypothetical protein